MPASLPPNPEDSDELRRRLNSPDPRDALSLRLSVRERVIAAIEARLERQPEDRHQRFILEEHQKARAEMLIELRSLNLEQDLRYRDLAAYVEDYVSGLGQDLVEAPDPDLAAELEALGHEQKAWEEMIEKVRARMQKRPGDPQLVRLLGEHQARLLRVQESRRLLEQGISLEPHTQPLPTQPQSTRHQDWSQERFPVEPGPDLPRPQAGPADAPAPEATLPAYAGDELVLERLDRPSPQPGPAPGATPGSSQGPTPGPVGGGEHSGNECSPEAAVASPREPDMAQQAEPSDPHLIALQRELLVFSGMVEKTRQRLAAKPELLHLKALIAQHEQRVAELRQQLAELEGREPDGSAADSASQA